MALIWQRFPGYDTKAQATKVKINCTTSKLKPSVHQSSQLIAKRQPMEWEKYLQIR
jgi:hypothetical protein